MDITGDVMEIPFEESKYNIVNVNAPNTLHSYFNTSRATQSPNPASVSPAAANNTSVIVPPARARINAVTSVTQLQPWIKYERAKKEGELASWQLARLFELEDTVLPVFN